jgi:nucleoside-diphosphate-sugar epimerase
MQNYKNIVFGASGLIGREVSRIVNINQSIIIYRKKKFLKKKFLWKKLDLDKDKLNGLPKYVENIFFFASPHYNMNNLKSKNIFSKEVKWIKKVLRYMQCKRFIYTSSSSVYSKNHKIGIQKRKIEKLLISSKIKHVQIWRPFNLVGYNQSNLSDHFHNLLIKKILINNSNKISFRGSMEEMKGYSTVKKFCKLLYKKSRLNQSFVYNYSNKNMVYLIQIVKLFLKVLKENNLQKFKFEFKNNIMSNKSNYVRVKKAKNIFSNENSNRVLNNYFNEMIKNEKRM